MKKFLLVLIISLVSTLNFAQFAEGDTLFKIDIPMDHEFLDVDNDGDFDLINMSTTSLVWHENLGDEEFGLAIPILADITGKADIYLADVNGDGWMDFTGNYINGGEKVSWFQNMGDGTFTENIILDGPVSRYQFYDDDADGDFDLIYCFETDGVSKVPGTGLGTFGTEILIDDTEFIYTHIYNTDFDNDGDIDIIFGAEDGIRDLYYTENLGGGIYATPVIIIAGILQRAGKIKFEDMDGDGDEDWIIGYGDLSYNLVYHENLGGSLGPEYNFFDWSSGDFTLGDIDMDGDIDLVGVDHPSEFKWHSNNGDNTFADEEILPIVLWETSGWTSPMAGIHLRDLDGDGDLDVYGDATIDYFFFMFYENFTISEYSATGNFFADLNENGVWDVDEVGVDFPDLTSDPEEAASFIYEDGSYFIGFETEDETYTISPVIPDNWAISTADLDYTILIDGIAVWEDLNFGIYPTEIIDSINAELVGSFPRCNDTISYVISTSNLGTTVTGGIISLTLNDSISYVSSAFPPDSIVEQTIYWTYDELLWYDDFLLNVQVAMPDYLSEGDFLTSYVSSSIIVDDVEIYLSEDSLTQMIVCAYDPNDKVGFPFGVDEEGYINADTEYMDYTIRFQNTGSDTAFTVRITDELDENFNWETFTVLTKSHDMEFSIDGAGEVEFLFDDIELPDSTTDFTGSQGFVKYRIYFEEGLPTSTTLENTANIFFDLNPAIVTNTTAHTPFDCENILAFIDLPTTVCADESINTTVSDLFFPSTTVISWNVGAETITGFEFDYTPAESGMLAIAITASTGFCSASETVMVDVLDAIAPTVLETATICEGDSIIIFDTYQTTAMLYSDTMSSVITGCDSVIQQTLAVYDLTPASFNALEDDILCPEEPSITLTALPAGGTFSGDGVVADSFDPALVGEGTYTLYYSYINDNDCSSTDSLTVTVTDCLNTFSDDKVAFVIYPNPFSAFTTLKFNSAMAGATVVLTDLQGRTLRTYQNVNGPELEIVKGELAEGVYLLHLFDANGNVQNVVKIIVE